MKQINKQATEEILRQMQSNDKMFRMIQPFKRIAIYQDLSSFGISANITFVRSDNDYPAILSIAILFWSLDIFLGKKNIKNATSRRCIFYDQIMNESAMCKHGNKIRAIYEMAISKGVECIAFQPSIKMISFLYSKDDVSARINIYYSTMTISMFNLLSNSPKNSVHLKKQSMRDVEFVLSNPMVKFKGQN